MYIALLLVGDLVAAIVTSPFVFVGGVFESLAVGETALRKNLPLHPAPIPFNAAVWRAYVSGFCEKRLAMLDDLISSRALIGKTKADLFDLFGGHGEAGDQAGSFGAKERLQDWDLVYTAGNGDLSQGWFDPCGIVYCYVVLRFGIDGRVAEAGVGEG